LLSAGDVCLLLLLLLLLPLVALVSAIAWVAVSFRVLFGEEAFLLEAVVVLVWFASLLSGGAVFLPVPLLLLLPLLVPLAVVVLLFGVLVGGEGFLLLPLVEASGT